MSSEGPSAKRVRKPGAGDSVDAEDKQQPMDTDAPEPLAPQEVCMTPPLIHYKCFDLFAVCVYTVPSRAKERPG